MAWKKNKNCTIVDRRPELTKLSETVVDSHDSFKSHNIVWIAKTTIFNRQFLGLWLFMYNS